MGNAPTSSRSKTLHTIQWISALAGLVLSLYLLIQHTRLKSGIQDGASICSMGQHFDCDAVDASPYSEVFGIPLAAFGSIFYFLLFLINFLAPLGSQSFRRLQTQAARLALVAFIVDLILLYIQLVILKTLCLFCAGTYLATVGYYVTACLMIGGPSPLLAPLRKISGPRLETKSQFLGLVAFIAFSGFVLALPSLIRSQSRMSGYEKLADRFFTQWQSLERKNISIDSSDPSYGSPNAKITIVEFSDFECPFCRKSAFTLHTVLKSAKNDVRLIFKNYPLDKSCNAKVGHSLHPMACRLAQLSYCANRKGKFWEYHNAVFYDLKPKPKWEDIKKAVRHIFTDEQADRCIANANSMLKVRADTKLGHQLNVDGTPTIYINGKKVSIPVTVDTIKTLISMERDMSSSY